MIIHSIKLENFKSYAGEKIIGPLHKNFTSVVGPNGSGKSNLIEALLFIFGYWAKKLRLTKFTDVIHKSKHYPNLKYAQVTVYFQDIIDYVEDDNYYETVEGTSFAISRYVMDTNITKYKVNNTEVTQKDIYQLLLSKGIDLEHNRFLILQGEVEMIAMMPPKGTKQNEVGLLDFLEDVIGTKKYVSSIEELKQ